jgi:hypothetical protein
MSKKLCSQGQLANWTKPLRGGLKTSRTTPASGFRLRFELCWKQLRSDAT